MSNAQKITSVSVAGGYWTGSSTVVDLLAEHADCTVVPEEFQIFSFGQFFDELFAPLMRGEFNHKLYSENSQRISEFNRSDLYPLRAIFRRLFGTINQYPQLFFSRRAGMGKRLGPAYISSCNALIKQLDVIYQDKSIKDLPTFQRLINDVLVEATLGATTEQRKDSVRFGIFDQLISPPFIKSTEAALPNLKYINIDRDWRDQYVSMRIPFLKMTARNRGVKVRPWGEDLSATFEDQPLPYFLGLRNRIDEVKNRQKSEPQDNMMWINYEQMVLDTEHSAQRVFEFLDLDPAKWTPRQQFFPEVSCKRIGKWKKGDWIKEPLKSEIAYLLERLGEPQY